MAALSALRTDFRTRMQDSAGGMLSATPANLYLNMACEDFQRDVQPVFREFGWYITAKQYRYDLPSDYQQIRSMMWYQAGVDYEIPYKSPKEFQKMGLMARNKGTSSNPRAFTIIDNDVYIGPAPATAGTTTTVTGAIGSTATTLVAGTTSGFNTVGYLSINSEQMGHYDVTTISTFAQLIRAQGGTDAAAHSGCDIVYELDMVMMCSYAHKYMSADSDTPGFQDRFHRDIVYYAAYLALKTEGRDDDAQKELQIYELRKRDAKREIRRQSRDSVSKFRSSYR